MANRSVLKRLRRICLGLPEVVETESWGNPTFKAGRKQFVVHEYYRGRPCLAFRLTIPEQKLLLQDPRFFTTPYVGRHGWTSLWLDGEFEWSMIEELIKSAYRNSANKRMLKALEEA